LPVTGVATLTRREVYENLARFRRARAAPALALAAFDLAAYLLLWLLLLLAGAWWIKLPLAAGCALGIARLFTIGHDACHGSYLRRNWANSLLGRIVFLFSYTPFSCWELGHNTLHHGFTNLRGRDYVWAPFSKREFDQLPLWRRGLERVYRHPLGPGVYYAIEIWWKKLWFPTARHVEPVCLVHWLDSLLVAGFLFLQIAAVRLAAGWTGQDPAALALFGLALPFVGWNVLMGFAILQHHTNPQVVWIADRKDWRPLESQVENTMHVVFPRVVNLLLNHIMEHTAHHVDVRIPMFELAAAQRAIEEMFPEQAPVARWSWKYYRDCCRACKLYDYESRVWLDFEGRPAPEPRRSGRVLQELQ
jgi:omega-6 fatty acid desaturase (delta-12 desaturase)